MKSILSKILIAGAAVIFLTSGLQASVINPRLGDTTKKSKMKMDKMEAKKTTKMDKMGAKKTAKDTGKMSKMSKM